MRLEIQVNTYKVDVSDVFTIRCWIRISDLCYPQHLEMAQCSSEIHIYVLDFGRENQTAKQEWSVPGLGL